MRAFESSPVHCLLEATSLGQSPKARKAWNSGYAAIDTIGYDALCNRLPALELELEASEDPGDEVVLERVPDALMKEVGGQELVSVVVWEVVGERLVHATEGIAQREEQSTYLASNQGSHHNRPTAPSRRRAVRVIWASCTAGTPALYMKR